jgi:hypothetical protein
LFDTSTICLTIEDYYDSVCLTGQLSSEWNALCFTHNLTDLVFNVTLNGEQIGSEKVNKKEDLKSNFLNKPAEPFSIGLEAPFLGQITDFNVWNRPLSIEEITQYSFGCQARLLAQPEILDWANTNITSRGFQSNIIQMQRQLLTCQNSLKQSHDFFQNTLAMSYSKSVEFCKFLRGDLIDPFKEELIWYPDNYWVPIVYPRTVTETNNTSLTTGQKAHLCMGVNIASKDYMPTNCSHELKSICKVSYYVKLGNMKIA